MFQKYTPAVVPAVDFLTNACKLLARTSGLLASKKSDVTWLERELIARRSTLERFAGAKRIFDVDDAIWLTERVPFSEDIVKHTHGVIAGNSFLADHYRSAGAKVWVVPTSVDTDVWKPAPPNGGREWTIGWIGTFSNLEYLYSIEEPLADFLNDHPAIKFLVVSDRRPRFKLIRYPTLRFVRWSSVTEVELVQRMDVGIMPLPDTEWARGKCACKMLLYMAVGIPVVVSPVGQNGRILEEANVGCPAVDANDWYMILRRLFFDQDQAFALGKAGRRLAEDRYSVRRNVVRLADIFWTVSKS